jgi:DNA-binding XRE family transcriptional regulator
MDAPAEALGVAPATVRAWERCGHRPRPHLRARLERCAGLPTVKADSGAAFGERLRAARPRAGLTQLELVERIGDAMAHRVALKLGNALQARTIPVGVSDHHLAFDATISLKPETLKLIVRDSVDSLVRDGPSPIVKLLAVAPRHSARNLPRSCAGHEFGQTERCIEGYVQNASVVPEVQ